MLNAPAIVRQLVQHKVEFVVIGGLAMVSHGSPYPTDDFDACYLRTPENIAALAAAFAAHQPYLRGAPPGLPFRWDAPTIQAGLNFTLTTDLGPVDFLGEVSGVGRYEQALANSVELDVCGFPIRVLTIDALIDAKKAAGRGKDRDHVRVLEELKKLHEEGQ